APEPRELASAERDLAGAARVPLVGGAEALVVTGGWFADAKLAADLARVTGLAVTLVSDGRATASTAVPPPQIPADPSEPFDVEGGRRGFVVSIPDGGGVLLLAAAARPVPSLPLWIVAGVALFLAVLLGWLLANVIARPLDRLAEGARAVAAGNLDARIEGTGRVDVGYLADAFNTMTANIRSYVEELKDSRDELRQTLERLGATLQSTHDLQGILEVVLDTSAVTLRASAGTIFLATEGEGELRLKVARGYEAPTEAVLPPGRGIAGRAAGGDPVLVAGGDVDVVSAIEPQADTAIAVPLIRWDRVLGVIALYGRSVPDPFRKHDVDTLASFAAQTSVAIENVLLHEEAERLSITDGLTGIFNRRYLQLSLRREIERAQRFGRSVSLLMLDLDRFKDVNDEHGHQRGDEVLVELARRVMGEIRTQIDQFARYGGEEFVILLPETPCDGALVVAEKIRKAVAARPFTSQTGPPVRVTVSIGVAAYPDDGESADDLLRTADAALYRAKERGRNRVVPSVRASERA
ncbi:MAG TPA: diguanylate cyclase, partial [Actinomycetota bacterium]|nr:diguanylate cyclase [Actinomycetota bacterium]